jgi:Acetyltransferase (GNAT) domain
MTLEARFYLPEDRAHWNSLNSSARNGHFIFNRDFMEYHADRFQDVSVVVVEDGELLALLPANRAGDTVYSHQGLTFGGLVLADRANTARVLAALRETVQLLAKSGVKSLVYKVVPTIYHARPAQEDLYALTRLRAALVRRDVTTTIDLSEPGQRSKRRERGIKKAKAQGLYTRKSDRWDEYWSILAETLASRHDVRPTHTVNEIIHLAARFPENISLVTTESESQLLAGLVVFETRTVAHAQYLASSVAGRDVGALDLAIDHAINEVLPHKRFFDFGISTTDQGRVLNEGLIKQKEEFGGGAVVHDVYELDIRAALEIAF